MTYTAADRFADEQELMRAQLRIDCDTRLRALEEAQEVTAGYVRHLMQVQAGESEHVQPDAFRYNVGLLASVLSEKLTPVTDPGLTLGAASVIADLGQADTEFTLTLSSEEFRLLMWVIEESGK